MMDNEKILKLFKQFAGDPLDIKGLVVTPVKVEPNVRRNSRTNMYFEVQNPNDVSYFSPIVENYIYDETEEFGNFINEKIDVFFVPSFKQGINILSGYGIESDIKQKQEEALPLGESMIPEAQPSLVVG